MRGSLLVIAVVEVAAVSSVWWGLGRDALMVGQDRVQVCHVCVQLS